MGYPQAPPPGWRPPAAPGPYVQPGSGAPWSGPPPWAQSQPGAPGWPVAPQPHTAQFGPSPDQRFPWLWALGITVALTVPQVLVSPFTAFFIYLAIPLGGVICSVVAVVCFTRVGRSRMVDAIGFGVVASPVLGILPILVVMQSQR